MWLMWGVLSEDAKYTAARRGNLDDEPAVTFDGPDLEKNVRLGRRLAQSLSRLQSSDFRQYSTHAWLQFAC
jgi:hypothetical protein